MRLFDWTYSLFLESLTLCSFFIAWVFRLGLKDVPGPGCPIILVHGYFAAPTVWYYQRKKLMGVGPIYNLNLGRPFLSIRDYAERLKEKADQVAKETGRADLILVGHSMGGLVSSYYAVHLAPHKVTDVITIGTPFAGTPIARYAFGSNAREMEPNSELLKELRAKMKIREQIRFYHIATRCDALVIPGESAVVDNNPHIIFNNLGHGSMLYSKRVAEAIRQWLKMDKEVTFAE